MSAHSEKLTFPGSHGASLAGRLELPEGTPRGYALFAHCFTCGMNVAAAARISRALTDFGIAVLRFDFTGLGKSGGDFSHTNFSSNIDDLEAAADFLRDNYEAPSLLIGHSLGGAAVLSVAHRIAEVKAVATIAAPADPEHVTHLLKGSREEIKAKGEADVDLAGRTFRIRQQFLDDIDEHPQAERIANLGAALMVMHSPVDNIVGADNARRIYDAARHPKSFVAIDGADHLLTNAGDSDFVAHMLATWASRYALDPVPEPDTVPDPAEGLVVVSEDGSGSFAQDVRVGKHRLIADEPEPTGTDTGPSPYDYLLAALGSCTSMTVRMYAERKKWDLDKVTVTLRHSRKHAQDCADCDTSATHMDHIERVIRFDGDLDDDQRQRLLEIADKCPVHRTLHSDIAIDTVVDTPQ